MTFLQKRLRDGGFGGDLRELRELRGVSRERLSEITKIHVSVIEALEEERLGDLKDPVYVVRHIRAIVRALEGRTAYVLEKYRALLEERQAIDARMMDVRQTVRRSDLFVISRAMGFVGFLLLVALALGYMGWQLRELRQAPQLAITGPQEGARLPTPYVEVRGVTDANAFVSINGRSAVVNPDGAFNLTFDIPRGLTTLTIEARRRYGKAVTETRRVTY